MFTPGSRYFLGITGLSAVSAVLYMFLINPSDIGSVALFGMLLSGGLIAGFSFFTRDGDSATTADAVEAATRAPQSSFWPIVFALGIALTLLGVATNPIVFVLGITVIVAGGAEWTVQNWSERASADGEYNGSVRHRVFGALDYPGLAAVATGVIAYLFSRVMLTASKGGAAVIFMIVAAIIMGLGFVFARKPELRSKAIALSLTVGTLILVVSGVASALAGERPQLAKYAKEKPYSAKNRECGAEESKYYDHHANNTVSLRSAVLATIFVEDGKVSAQMIGLKKDVDTITVPRSNATNIMFRNLDEEEHRLVVNLGTAVVAETGIKEKVGTCTQLTGKNQEQVLTLNIPKPSTADQVYSFTVPGAEGEIKLVVP